MYFFSVLLKGHCYPNNNGKYIGKKHNSKKDFPCLSVHLNRPLYFPSAPNVCLPDLALPFCFLEHSLTSGVI